MRYELSEEDKRNIEAHPEYSNVSKKYLHNKELKFYNGLKFDSWIHVEIWLIVLEKTSGYRYASSVRTVKAAPVNPKRRHPIRLELVYYQRPYNCVLGQKLPSKSANVRNKPSSKINCAAGFRFKATSDGRHLELLDVVKKHNHPSANDACNLQDDDTHSSEDDDVSNLDANRLKSNDNLVNRHDDSSSIEDNSLLSKKVTYEEFESCVGITSSKTEENNDTSKSSQDLNIAEEKKSDDNNSDVGKDVSSVVYGDSMHEKIHSNYSLRLSTSSSQEFNDDDSKVALSESEDSNSLKDSTSPEDEQKKMEKFPPADQQATERTARDMDNEPSTSGHFKGAIPKLQQEKTKANKKLQKDDSSDEEIRTKSLIERGGKQKIPAVLKKADKILYNLNDGNADIDDSTQMSDIKYGEIVRTRGRPKGRTQKAIGLPFEKKKKNSSFISKTQLQRVQQLLSLIMEKSAVTSVLNHEFQVDIGDLPSSTSIPDPFLNEDVNPDIFMEFFTAKALKELIKRLRLKRKKHVDTCRICDKHAKEGSVLCDSCLFWYHFKCVNLRKEPRTKHWFCPKCMQ